MQPGISFEHQPTPWEHHVFNRYYRVLPVRQMELLLLVWSLPTQHHNWRTKPIAFLSELIGDEGHGKLKKPPMTLLATHCSNFVTET